MIHETLCSFGCDRKGNVAIILALSRPGRLLDRHGAGLFQRHRKTVAAQRRYRRRRARRSDAINDDAVERGSASAATNIFNAEASAMSGVSNTNPTVTITSSNGGLTGRRLSATAPRR